MSRQRIRRKCRCCKTFFFPDYRNAKRQSFCSAPECRRASKAAAQRKWIGKDDNRDYFRGEKHVERVQDWRKEHPGYWRKKKSGLEPAQVPGKEQVKSEQRSCNVPGRDLGALQDLWPHLNLTEHPAFVGLISMITGRTLQDDIAATGRNLIIRGENILGLKAPESAENTTPRSHDSQTLDSSRSTPPGASQLQLG